MEDKNKYNPDYDDNKKTDTIYVSKKQEWGGRYVEQVNDEEERSFVVAEKDSATLYITSGGRQKIKATLLENDDGNKVPVLYVSRINVKTGKIHSSGEEQICLYPEVMERLYNFIGKIKSIDYSNPHSFKVKEDDFDNLEDSPVKGSDSYFADLKDNHVEGSALIKKLLQEPGLLKGFEIEDISKLSNIKKKENDLTEFEYRLVNMGDFKEDTGDDNWQDWFNDKKWLFGSEVVQIINERRVDHNGKFDYIIKSDDGFVDLVEIKNPPLPFWASTKDRDNFYPSTDLNKAITQSIKYIYSLEKKMDIKSTSEDIGDILKPQCTLIIGRTEGWTPEHYQSFRILNASFHNLTILTYDMLLERAKKINSTETQTNPE